MSKFGGVPVASSEPGKTSKFGGIAAQSSSSSPDDASPSDTRPTSQTLGFEEGMANVWDRAAQTLKWTANQLKIPGSRGASNQGEGVGMGDALDWAGQKMGLNTAEGATAQHAQHFAEQEKTQRPGGAGRFAGEVVGSLPLGGIENPWLAGAAVGGLTGHGDTPAGVAFDVGTGAVGGKVGNMAVRGIGKLASPILRSAQTRASTYVSRLMDTAGKSADDLEGYAKGTFGKPVTGAEAIGRTGKTSLTALGRRSGETPEALEGYITNRRAERSGRMLEDISQSAGVAPSAAMGELDEVVSAGRKEAAPLYELAFSSPPKTSPYLERLGSDPIIQKGIQHGYRIEQLSALAEHRPFDPNAYGVIGFEPIQQGTVWRNITDSQGNVANVPVFGKMLPWYTWDAAKTGLDHILESNYRNPLTGRLELDKMGREIDHVRRAMLTEVDSLNPAYAAARERAGDYLSAKEAFHEGSKALFNGNVTEKQFSSRLGKMSQSDQQSLKGGIANYLYDLAQKGRLKPATLKTPRVQAKLIMAFGQEKAKALIDRVSIEDEMAKAEGRMQPGTGSVTAEVLGANAEQDMTGVAQELAHAGAYAAAGMHHAAVFRLANVLKRLPAFARTADMPVEVRNEVGKLLMMTPDELASYIRTQPAKIQAITQAIQHAAQVTTPVTATAATEIAP